MAENRQNDGEYIKKFRAYGVILGTPPPDQSSMYATGGFSRNSD